jgi:hypothetical protein
MDTTRDLCEKFITSVFIRRAVQRLTTSRSIILRLRRVRHFVSMMLADTVTKLSGLRDEQN